jgi:hypothetical protein
MLVILTAVDRPVTSSPLILALVLQRPAPRSDQRPVRMRLAGRRRPKSFEFWLLLIGFGCSDCGLRPHGLRPRGLIFSPPSTKAGWSSSPCAPRIVAPAECTTPGLRWGVRLSHHQLQIRLIEPTASAAATSLLLTFHRHPHDRRGDSWTRRRPRSVSSPHWGARLTLQLFLLRTAVSRNSDHPASGSNGSVALEATAP